MLGNTALVLNINLADDQGSEILDSRLGDSVCVFVNILVGNASYRICYLGYLCAIDIRGILRV